MEEDGKFNEEYIAFETYLGSSRFARKTQNEGNWKRGDMA